MTAVDLYAHYQHWCQKNTTRAFASQAFHQASGEEMETNPGLKYRHDLPGEQRGEQRVEMPRASSKGRKWKVREQVRPVRGGPDAGCC